MLKHLKENNETYLNHLKFAWVAAFHMLISCCFFLVHGLIPAIPIPKLFNLEAMYRKLKKWDAYSQIRKLK